MTEVNEPTFAEKAGLPEMNVVHTHVETARNDIEDIIKALYEASGTTEEDVISSEAELTDPVVRAYLWSAPMRRMCLAVITYLQISDKAEALFAGDYPNETKRIAAIIRGEVGAGG